MLEVCREKKKKQCKSLLNSYNKKKNCKGLLSISHAKSLH